ncbi:V-type ATP synthase subunit D, partial [Mycobacterium sp.]|uniref:V-type ATP synthase subunit D n=1 Tax=Mycobacterium sp. TaxID=1785 RepID=UPI003F9DC938
MAPLSRPPGRMGRLWVLNRLDLAERGVTLLEQKLHLLTALQEELQRKAEQSRHDWQQACREADMWGLRAMLLGGQNAIDLAVTTAPASVTVQWAVTAGVRYPDAAVCVLPSESDPAVIYPTSASVQAARAYRAAVVAAAECAAAQSSFRTVEQEVHTTRLRVRALSRHWLPLLRQELARIEL